nr:immunoglobulin light chain junction region [Macaca mulatta]MOX52001.1 immunoglobulin light chain junction region [Macaca mulatta]MOX52465.1 immunoglobulin light chain junction region [Macaca mulatta]MOX53176.1 immunoglobulin light chain junction region [Macaca mulatta]MOX53493.1 immunoglobulin light chain junction region [Macaca mulatta]
CLQSKHSYIF